MAKNLGGMAKGDMIASEGKYHPADVMPKISGYDGDNMSREKGGKMPHQIFHDKMATKLGC